MSTSSTLRVSDRPGVFGGNFVFRISSFRIIKICIMSKEESTILKGIAILLMLFLHLFNKTTLPEMCHPMIYIGDTPLVHILTRATNPVDFFVILSGYGLAFLYQKETLNFRSQLRRLSKLYIHYWLILLVFVTIGSFIRPDSYPGDVWKIIGNVTSWSSNYNYEHWFLFPYAMLSLTAYPLFKLMDKLGNVWTLILFFLISLVSMYFTSRYIAANKLYDSVEAHILTYFGFLFSFAIGAVMFCVSQVHSLHIAKFKKHPWLPIILLILLVVIKCTWWHTAIHAVYVFLFIWFFLNIPLHSVVRRLLVAMGKHSMPMWLIHTFFCNYLFHDFIYGFQYPVIIYMVLLIISYMCSFPIIWCAKWIIGKVM